jgi:transcriptional regulator of acetoin/glycerol metabolism
MPLAARFSLLHSDLNDFLFASVGDEQNGMALNVISALTRLGKAGLSPTATARQLGLGRSTVYREVGRAGVQRTP